MERRLFLAIGLSLLVVWLWSSTAPKTKDPSLLSKNSQPIESIKDAAISQNPDQKNVIEESNMVKELPSKGLLEITKTLVSENLEMDVSSLGGTIKNISIKEYDTTFPLDEVMALSGYKTAPFSVERADDKSIRCVFENDQIKIVKEYSLQGDYLIAAKILFSNKSDMSKLIDLSIDSYTIKMSSLDKNNKELTRIETRDRSLNEYVVNSEKGIQRKGGAFKFSSKEAKAVSGKVFWSGFRNRYFCFLIKPEYDTKGYTINPVSDTSLKVSVESKEVSIPPHGNVQFDSILYAGPEKIDLLKGYGFGFEKIQRYYRMPLFDGIAKIIASLMQLIHKAIPNWGVCIILISVIIYFSMYPLTMRGMLSMKRMQALQPMIAKLKEKYKDNPQKMNKEMMELYKEHKVNPLGGCLPMLLQMPVFIGLYQVLWRSVSFKGAHFLWIKDLSQPDRLYIFPFSLPILGNELNLLPLVMVVVMFFQQKLSAKNMVVSDPSQAAQQKMMTTIMPLFLGFIFYKFASGLTLYFTMFYFFSTFTQWKMSKSVKVG